ncbi:MAG TPA: MBOAT family O-acyltransferase [Pseudomonadales bacterium]
MTAESITTVLWLLGGVTGYWATPARWRDVFLPTFTAALLGYYAPASLAALTALAAITWLAAHGRRSSTASAARLMSGAGFILLTLVIYRISSRELQEDGSTALLLGFAFYTLRLMHYLFEVYKRTITHGEWRTFVAWLFFFPSISVGPIHRYPEFRRDLLRQRWDSALFSEGLERILYGYVKIVVIASGLIGGHASPWIESTAQASPTAHAWLLCLEYGALLYFKFAGYSDIAIGVSRLLGFRIIENFNYPFIAANMGDFWKRWHISLSSWCRDYAYMPVWSRWRNGALAAIASMLILGLWHELSWRYLVWGLYHGTGIMLWQRWHTATTDYRQRLPRAAQWAWYGLAWCLTLGFVIAGFAITRETTLNKGIALLMQLFGVR